MHLALRPFGAFTFALSFGLLTLLAPRAPAQKSDLKKALPPSTMLFVSMPDLDSSIQEMMTMPLVKMWHEEEVQAFFAEGLKWARGEWDKNLAQARKAHQQGMLPFNPDELLKLR